MIAAVMMVMLIDLLSTYILDLSTLCYSQIFLLRFEISAIFSLVSPIILYNLKM